MKEPRKSQLCTGLKLLTKWQEKENWVFYNKMTSQFELLFYNFTRYRIPSQKFFATHLYKFLDKLKEKKKVELALIFVSKDKIKKLNQFWRKKEESTTVLSFPLNELKDLDVSQKKKMETNKDLGEIVFCPLEIKKRSFQEGRSEKEMYRRLLAHAVLHLYGYSHDTLKNWKKMEKKEKDLLG